MKSCGNSLFPFLSKTGIQKTKFYGVKVMTGSKIKRLLMICSGLFIAYGVSASDLTVPNTFSAGSAAVADEVNANFDAVAIAVNDNNARIGELESGAGATFQASEAYVFGTATAVAGAGTLLRSSNAVDLRVAMAGLDQNAMYTLWWIIFNNPEECMAGTAPALCGEPDLGVEAVNPGVRNAAGYMTGADGTMNLTSRLLAGSPVAGSAAAGFGMLEDSVGAEVHIVIQAHGDPMLESVGIQMTVPGGACNPDCEDQFAIIFLPEPVAVP